jgi:predicted DNA-binding transcriptional regulator AlpA
MGRKVDVDDLVDARVVAEILGLSHPNTVIQYQHRHADMPAPALDLGHRRIKLWLRSEIETWDQERKATGRYKPGRRPAR